MATNAPFTNAEGSQQLALKEKRKALLIKSQIVQKLHTYINNLTPSTELKHK